MSKTMTYILKWVFWLFVFVFVSFVMGAIVFNWDDWRTFLLDVAKTLSVQLFIAVLIFAWLIAIYSMVRIIFGMRHVSKNGLINIFLASTILALPFISLIFQRPIDLYDLGQTALIVVVGLLCGSFQRTLSDFRRNLRKGFSPKRTSKFTALQMNSVNKVVYQNLLLKARGDKELVERLVEYEYTRSPNASLRSLMDSAVVRWELDNR
jgi:hypothetical protein